MFNSLSTPERSFVSAICEAQETYDPKCRINQRFWNALRHAEFIYGIEPAVRTDLAADALRSTYAMFSGYTADDIAYRFKTVENRFGIRVSEAPAPALAA
jgi:hypothetical protein